MRRAFPDIKVLTLSAHSDDAYVETVMALGAAGYLVKQTCAHYLSEAVREVGKGSTYLSAAIARRYRRRHQVSIDPKGRSKTNVTRLSSREVEVLQLIAEGAAN